MKKMKKTDKKTFFIEIKNQKIKNGFLYNTTPDSDLPKSNPLPIQTPSCGSRFGPLPMALDSDPRTIQANSSKTP